MNVLGVWTTAAIILVVLTQLEVLNAHAIMVLQETVLIAQVSTSCEPSTRAVHRAEQGETTAP